MLIMALSPAPSSWPPVSSKPTFLPLPLQTDPATLPTDALAPFVAVGPLLAGALAVHGANGSLLYLNPAAASLLGIDPVAARGLGLDDPHWQFVDALKRRLLPDEYPVAKALRAQGEVAGEVEDNVLGIRFAGESEPRHWVRASARLLRDTAGAVEMVVVSFTEITSEIRATHEAEAQRQQLQSVLENTPIGVCITDGDGHYVYVNQAYEDFYGYQAEELLGQHFSMVVPEEGRAYLTQLHSDFLAHGREMRGEWEVMNRDGERKTILADAARIYDRDGRPQKVTFVLDISERKAMETALRESVLLLEQLASVDTLTGLLNRGQLELSLRREMKRARRLDQALVVAMLDLDHFKQINDAHGHGCGDHALRKMGRALHGLLRESDVALRYGGEEFLLILPHTDIEQAQGLLARLRDWLQQYPVECAGGPLEFSAGVTALHPEDDDRSLLARADALLYRAKAEGRDRVITG